jgi:hypothetical protein
MDWNRWMRKWIYLGKAGAFLTGKLGSTGTWIARCEMDRRVLRQTEFKEKKERTGWMP